METPVMKAWREFALADPEDCDREYDAYLALLNKMETASGYSPMNSTSSLHHRASAAAVMAPSTTRSTAPVSAPSGATSSSRDDLSPEARRMYDYIVGNSDELASRDGLSPGARRHYDFLIGSSSAPSSSTAPHATSSAISTTTPTAAVSASTSTRDSRAATKDEPTPGARRIYDYIVGVSESCCLDPEPVVATATHKMDFNSVTPSTYSTICLGGNTSVATTPSPARSPTTVSTMLPSPTEIEDIQEAVDFAAVDLTASAPTTCLAEYPSHDDDESVSELISSTTKTSSTTIGDVLSELAAPIVADRALDVDATGYTSPTIAICLSGGSNHSINREDPMHVSPWNVHTLLKVSPRNSPKPPLVPLIVPELFTWSPTCSTDCLCHSIKTSSRLLPDAYMEFNIGPNVSTMAPWPPPSCTCAGTSLIFGHDLCHSVQQKRGEKFSVVRMIPQSWPPSLGLCTNLSTGNFLSSSGSITVNDNNSRHANWCLDDVFWKLPRWWSHTQCVRPTNAILDVSSWTWVRNVSVTHTMELTLVLLATYPTENSNGTIASRKRNDTDGDTSQPVIFSSDSDYLELVLRLIIKLFSWSPHPKWPLMSLNGPFLISTYVQQEFMEMYNVTAVLSRLLVLVVVSTEAMLGTVFQFATGNTIILLPWDPGLLLPGMDTMFSTLVDGLAIRLISSREITCLKGIPMHELFSCSLVVELIKKGMGAIEELQPWTFWEGPLLVTTVYHNPPPAKPPDKSNYTQDKRVRIQWSILIVTCFCNFSCLVRSGNLFEFKFNGKTFQCSNVIIRMSEGATHYESACFSWVIAWLLVQTSYACSGFGGRKHVTIMSIPLDILLQDWISCLMGHIIQCDFLQWKIDLSLNWELLELARPNSEEFLIHHMGEIFQANFLVSCYWLGDVTVGYMFCARFNHTRAYFPLVDLKPNNKDMNSLDYPIPSTGCVLWECLDVGNQPKHFISATTLTYQVWYFSWDPGIWGLLRFCGEFAQGVAKGGIMVEGPAYCYYHYIAVFLGQAPSATTTSSMLCKSTSTRSTTPSTVILTCIMEESHVPWDPGGSSRDRLGGKPNFKIGGLSATSLHSLLGCLVGRLLGPGLLGSWSRRENICPGEQPEGVGLERKDWTAASAEGWRACVACVLFCFFLLD